MGLSEFWGREHLQPYIRGAERRSVAFCFILPLSFLEHTPVNTPQFDVGSTGMCMSRNDLTVNLVEGTSAIAIVWGRLSGGGGAFVVASVRDAWVPAGRYVTYTWLVLRYT